MIVRVTGKVSYNPDRLYKSPSPGKTFCDLLYIFDPTSLHSPPSQASNGRILTCVRFLFARGDFTRNPKFSYLVVTLMVLHRFICSPWSSYFTFKNIYLLKFHLLLLNVHLLMPQMSLSRKIARKSKIAVLVQDAGHKSPWPCKTFLRNIKIATLSLVISVISGDRWYLWCFYMFFYYSCDFVETYFLIWCNSHFVTKWNTGY